MLDLVFKKNKNTLSSESSQINLKNEYIFQRLTKFGVLFQIFCQESYFCYVESNKEATTFFYYQTVNSTKYSLQSWKYFVLRKRNSFQQQTRVVADTKDFYKQKEMLLSKLFQCC